MSTRIDITKETLISLPQAARMLPPLRAGQKLNPSTVWRWVTTGTKRWDGVVVRLDARRVGQRWMTSVEALERFSDALTPRFDDLPAAEEIAGTDRAEAVERQLAEAGI